MEEFQDLKFLEKKYEKFNDQTKINYKRKF